MRRKQNISNYIIATFSNFLIRVSLQPWSCKLFKLRLFDLTEFIDWNIQGLLLLVAKRKIRACDKCLHRVIKWNYKMCFLNKSLKIPTSSRLPAFIRSSAEPPPKYSIIIHNFVPCDTHHINIFKKKFFFKGSVREKWKGV